MLGVQADITNYIRVGEDCSYKRRSEMKNTLSIVRESRLSGQRMVGLDSCVLIDLIDNPDFFAAPGCDIFNEDYLLFTHKRCIREIKDWLLEERGYDEEGAGRKVDLFLAEKHIRIMQPNFSQPEILDEMKKKCREKKIEFHSPDSWIIADFYKAGINKVYSTNNHFLDACRLFGMDGGKFPTFEKKLNDTLREMFRKRR